jgi:Effector-associated domain 11
MENHFEFFDNFISHRGFDKFKKDFTSTHVEADALYWIEKVEYDEEHEMRIITYTSDYYIEFQYDKIETVSIFSEFLQEKINEETIKFTTSIEKIVNTLSENQAKSFLEQLLKKTEKLLRQLSVYREANCYHSILSALNFIKEFLIDDISENDKILIQANLNTQTNKSKIDKQNLLKLIGEANFDVVVKQLLEYGVKEFDEDIILLSSRWHLVQEHFKQNIIQRNDYELESNKIVIGLMSLVKKLEI